MKTVEGAQDVGKRKSSDQPLLDAVALQRRDGWIVGLDLGAVEKFEPAELQGAGFRSKHVMKTHENLFRK